MIQNNLDGREGTVMLGKRTEGAQSWTADITHTKRGSPPSLRLQPNTPKSKGDSEVVER